MANHVFIAKVNYSKSNSCSTVKIEVRGLNIEVFVLKGKAIDMEDLILIFKENKELFIPLLMGVGYARKNNFKLTSTKGMSGRKDFWLMEYQPFDAWNYTQKPHHILHISCMGMLNEGVRCFAPDLGLVIFENHKDDFEKIVLRGEDVEGVRVSLKEIPIIHELEIDPWNWVNGNDFETFREACLASINIKADTNFFGEEKGKTI